MSTEAEHQPNLRSFQLEVLYGHLFLELLAGIGSMALVPFLFWNTVDTVYLYAWLGAALLVYWGRFVLGQIYRRSASKSSASRIWLMLFFAGAALAGLVWGWAGIVAVSQDSVYRMGFMLFWMSCLSFATLAVYSGALGVSLAFAVPAFSPAIAYLFTQGGQIKLAMAAMLFLFLVVLSLSAVKLHKAFSATAVLRGQSKHLLDLFEASRLQIEKLNVAVKTHTDEREQVAEELRRVSAELSLKEVKVKTLVETLKRLVLTCPITGLPNRRHFDHAIGTEWRRLLRDKKPLSLIMLDLDHVDQAKDFAGSELGKACLKRVATVLNSLGRRGGDLAARYGDTRFCLLLVSGDTKSALRIAEDLRGRIESLKIRCDPVDPNLCLTVHIGVATVIPASGAGPQELVHRADAALYEANFQGGNRVVSYRSLSELRLERWNAQQDGPLTGDALRRKLVLRGFEAAPSQHQVHTRIADRAREAGSVSAVVSGELQVTIEGQSWVLKPGDCLFVPAGATCSAEVVGRDPVVLLDAVKAS